jgi:DNA-binding beta-propeller fold protein YncE
MPPGFVTRPAIILEKDMNLFRALGIVAVLWPLSAGTGEAQVVVSANDSKATLVDGVNTPVRNPTPDTVTILDLSTTPPRIIGEVRAPNSVVGPPQSVAIAPDESIALVASSTKIDPADPARTIPDDVVTVIDLKASPPAVLATIHAGRGASGVSFNPAGTLALVANRMEGTVSVFTVNGKTVTAAGKVDLGAPDSGPSHVAFTRDGRMALVTRNNDSFISLLAVEGASVTYSKRDIAAGLKPYGLEVSPTADLALVANIGAGATGGADTISVIDLAANPPRAIDHVTVGPVAEGIAVSSDGQYLAVTVMNGTNAPKSSPLFNDFGRLRVYRVANRTLTPVAEARIGHWCQGAAWSRDSRTLLAQCMVEREILVFGFDGRRLSPAGSVKVNGGPAGIRTASRC